MAGLSEYAGLEIARERQATLIAQAQRVSAGRPPRRSLAAGLGRGLGHLAREARSLTSDLLARQPSRVDFYECCGRLVRCTGVGVCTDGAMRP